MLWKRVTNNPDRLSPAEFILFYLQEGDVCGFSPAYALKMFPQFIVKWRYLLDSCRIWKEDISRLRGLVPRKFRKLLAEEYRRMSRLCISYKKYRFTDKIVVDMRTRYIIHMNRIYPVPMIPEEEDISYGYSDL